MASGNDQTIHEIFADNDSENEDEFEDIYILTWIMKMKMVGQTYLTLKNGM